MTNSDARAELQTHRSSASRAKVCRHRGSNDSHTSGIGNENDLNGLMPVSELESACQSSLLKGRALPASRPEHDISSAFRTTLIKPPIPAAGPRHRMMIHTTPMRLFSINKPIPIELSRYGTKLPIIQLQGGSTPSFSSCSPASPGSFREWNPAAPTMISDHRGSRQRPATYWVGHQDQKLTPPG